MKQIVSNYSYSPATNVVTLTGVNIDADQLLLIVAPQVGRTLYNFASVTGVVSAGADTRVTLNASTAGLTTTSPLVIFYDDQGSTQTVAGTVTANTSYAVNVTGNAGLAASTVTAIPVALVDRGVYGGNLLGYNGTNTYLNTAIESVGGNSLRAGGTFPVSGSVTIGNSVTIGSLPTISGTVTASLAPQAKGPVYEVDSLVPSDPKYMIMVGGLDYAGTQETRQLRTDGGGRVEVASIANSVTIGSLPAISGTVTANASNGSLTTRFGTPTTANTAFATSAVTNANRKYLLIQNVTTGSNVITVGIGFTPTTTQGIQLTAGAGITFESSYIPTGAVYVLSSVTASNFTILEA